MSKPTKHKAAVPSVSLPLSTRAGRKAAISVPRQSIPRGPSLSLERLQSWNGAIAASLRGTEPSDIAAELIRGLLDVVRADAVYVGFLRRAKPPIALLREESDERDRQYVEGAYLLDPNYKLFLQSNPSVCIALKDVEADEFMRGEYYKTYYQYTGVIDEVAFLVRLTDDVAGHVCVMRLNGSTSFRRADIASLVTVQPLVELVSERIWSRMSAGDASQMAADGEAHRVFAARLEQFGADVLSERKLEIMRLLLKGYGAKEIGRILNIASGTVRNHMKHIYAQMSVTSQSELFALFFDTLMNTGPN